MARRLSTGALLPDYTDIRQMWWGRYSKDAWHPSRWDGPEAAILNGS